MGIQINGNTNNINAGIGSLSIEDINELDIVGVATAANFKTGVSNLHSVGLSLSGGQIDVGSNIKIGNAGVITATSFVGSGANLTGLTIPGGGTGLDLNDNARIRLGTGNDLQIWHNGSESFISEAGTGGLTMYADHLKLENPSGEKMIYATSNGAVELYYNNTKMLETNIPSGHNGEVILGQKVHIRHTGSGNGQIFPSSGNMYVNAKLGKTSILCVADGAVQLYHDNSLKFETTASGTAVTGSVVVTGGANESPVTVTTSNDYVGKFESTDAHARLIVEDNTSTTGHNGLQVFGDTCMLVAGNAFSVRGIGGGATEILHAGTKKLSTSVTGITVTGEVASTQDYPNFRPTVDFNFAGEKKLDPRITYTRTGPASFVNEFGKVVLVGDNAPRFDHDPTTRECKGLLIEESRTNLFPYGTTPGDLWSSSKSGTFEENTTETTAPDGTFTATKWTFTNSDPYLYHAQTLSANTSYTVTMYVKAGTNMAGDYVQIRIGAAPYSPNGDDITVPTDGTWKRISYTKTVGGSAENSANVGFEPQVKPSGNPASGDVIYIWGAQLEVGSFATSFISTNGSTATRGSDLTIIDGEEFSEFYNPVESTILVNHTHLDGITSSNLGTERRVYRFRVNTGADTRIDYVSNSNYNPYIAKDGSAVASISDGVATVFGGGANKLAVRVKENSFATCQNGTLGLEDTNGAWNPTNAIDHVTLGGSATGNLNDTVVNNNALCGHIQRFMYYSTGLPNSQLKTLTS